MSGRKGQKWTLTVQWILIKGKGVTQNQKNEANSNAFCSEISKENIVMSVLHHKTMFLERMNCINLSNWSRWALLTWNRTKWINDSINSGFLNQKRSSRGFSFAPTECPVRPAVSKAKVAITCCSFAPTRRTSCPWCETLEKPNKICKGT